MALCLQGLCLGAGHGLSRAGDLGLLGSQLGREHHKTMGLGLQAAFTAQTCRLPGIYIHLAPTNKGVSILPTLRLSSCPRTA